MATTRRLQSWWHEAGPRARFSASLFVGALLGWLVTALWVWWYQRGFHPFEQVMLLISWGALMLTAGNMIITSEVGEGCTCCPMHRDLSNQGRELTMAKGAGTSTRSNGGAMPKGAGKPQPLKVDQPKAPLKTQKKVNSNTSGK